MLPRQFSQCMLTPGDLNPLHDNTTVVGTFNPGAADLGDDGVALVVRVVEEITEKRDDAFASPRIDKAGELVIDWLNKDEVDTFDPRVYTFKKDGALRLRFISHLRVLISKDGRSFDSFDDAVTILPEGEYEEYGIEDPRITKIGGTYYITYVAVSRHGVVTKLMSTTDFRTFHRHGIIFCPDNKDVVFFPEKILGSYVAMHRPMPSMKFSTPKIWLARSSDLIHWGAHEQLLSGEQETSERIGGGTPPIKTERGWLTVYHANEKIPLAEDGRLRVRYVGGALLLDHENPKKIIGGTTEHIMVPELDFETKGFVDNVVFPTAVIDRGEHYLCYYGAADENLGVCAWAKSDLDEALVRMS